MKKRRAAWGVWLLCSLLLYLFENNTGTRTLLLAGVLVPAFSALCARFAAKKAVCTLEVPKACKKGKMAACRLVAGGSRLLLFSVVTASLCARNLLSAVETQLTVEAGGATRIQKDFSVSDSCCGTIRLAAEQILISDMFGLFSFPAAAFEPQYISVLPELLSVTLNIAESAALAESSERWSQLRPGNDPSETFAIREFIPGDPIRQIHWKLSQKADKLMIRELGLPVSDDILLLFESALSPASRPKDTPAAAEALLSVSSALLEDAVPHTIAWRSAALGELESIEILNGEDMKTASAAILASESQYSDETVGPAFLKSGERLFAHIAVFSARPDTDVVSLLGGGRVNLVLPESLAGSASYG